jgi:hypothetical protein
MKRTVLSLIASAALVTGASVAFAQQSSPSTNTKINYGVNGAPNYHTVAPAGVGSTAVKINYGVNGAPNYKSTTATTAPRTAARRQTASVKSTQQHAMHYRRHTPAS